MKTRHIFLTGTMALSAFAVTSCSLDTESMTQQNDETAYRNLEAAELGGHRFCIE